MSARASIALTVLALAGTATQASDFAVFPVKEIEGLGASASADSRSLVDAGVARRYLTPETQRVLLTHFVAEVARLFPQSVVHAKQVGAVRRGTYAFVDSDSQGCGTGPYTAALGDSYAVVLGVTRASEYRIERGSNTETMIPLTLSVQLIKPDQGKPVLGLSETVVLPVMAKTTEMGTPALEARIREALAGNLKAQVSSLIEKLRQDFNPRPTTVNVLGRDGDLLVIDRGAEAGFKTGDEPEAVRASQPDAPALLFRVLSAQQGLSVLKPLQGRAERGDALTFMLATQADDGLKPRLMPVPSSDPSRADEAAIATLFAREVGFKAPFQIAPADANLARSMESIKAQANCIADWNLYPGATQIKGSRHDAPNFFLRLGLDRTPVHSAHGTGGTLSRDRFETLVTAQVVDRHGRIVHSDLARDPYEVNRVAGAGLSLQSAYEVSMKNATLKLADSFVKAARLIPKEFRIQRATAGQLWVDGLGATEGDRLVYTVLRPLSVKVAGQPVMVPLELGEGAEGARRDGAATVLSYTVTSSELPPPREGDVLRVESLPRIGSEHVTQCGLPPHVGSGMTNLPFAVQLASNALYRSKRYGAVLTDTGFFGDVRRLLDAGNYPATLQPPAAPAACFQPGYIVRPEGGACDGDTCSVEVLNGIAIRIRHGDTVSREMFAARKSTFSDFNPPERDSLVGYSAMGSLADSIVELQKKVDATN